MLDFMSEYAGTYININAFNKVSTPKKYGEAIIIKHGNKTKKKRGKKK